MASFFKRIFNERVLWYIRRGTTVTGTMLAMGYGFYYLVERQRLPASHPESDEKKLLPEGSDAARRARMEQEAFIESMFADVSNDDKQRVYRRYNGTNAPKNVAPPPAGTEIAPLEPEIEKPRVRKITVVRKKGSDDGGGH